VEVACASTPATLSNGSFYARRYNKSLDASGGSVFRIIKDAAEGEGNRAAASTQPLGLLEISMHSSLRWSILMFVAPLIIGCSVLGNAQEPTIKFISDGGMCPYGGCRSAVVIKLNGTYTWTEGPGQRGYQQIRGKGQISTREMKLLLQEIDATDFAKIKSHKFVGTCPTAYDGQENTFVFPTPKGEEAISSCKYTIDPNEQVLIHIKKLVTEIFARPNT
jgi:hypothetical protein